MYFRIASFAWFAFIMGLVCGSVGEVNEHGYTISFEHVIAMFFFIGFSLLLGFFAGREVKNG